MTEMTIGQWNQANRHMIWSIYNYKDWERIDQDTFTSEEEARRAYETVRLDLAAPDGLPDGSYTLVCHGFNNRRGRADGALIRQGKCDPDSFDQAAYTALCRAYNIDPDHPATRRLSAPSLLHRKPHLGPRRTGDTGISRLLTNAATDRDRPNTKQNNTMQERHAMDQTALRQLERQLTVIETEQKRLAQLAAHFRGVLSFYRNDQEPLRKPESQYLREHIRLTLLVNGQPMHAAKILEALQANAITVPGRDPAANLRSHMSSDPDQRFKPVGQGAWALTEWDNAPPSSPPQLETPEVTPAVTPVVPELPETAPTCSSRPPSEDLQPVF